jgi:adenylylsulfate kinase
MSGVVMWFTGLPSSGKSALARDVRAALSEGGVTSVLLDGDDVRASIHPVPEYSVKARRDFYRTLSCLAALLAKQGHVVLVAATANRRFYRAFARKLAPRFIEVFVDTPLDECRRRNAKGLYGAGHALPGEKVPYERPKQPDVHVKRGTSAHAVKKCVAALQ